MTSVILRTTARMLHPVLLLTAIFLLLRGHNEPGGGFSGGLVGAAAFALQGLAYDWRQARRALVLEPHMLVGAGVLSGLGGGLVGVGLKGALLAGVWTSIPLPGLGELTIGTPLVFDVGVFLVVIGMTMMIIFALLEEEA